MTRDRSKVLKTLQLVRGTTRRSLTEAVAFEQSNRRIIAEVVERECPQFLLGCPDELRTASRELLAEARAHIQTVLTNLSALANVCRPSTRRRIDTSDGRISSRTRKSELVSGGTAPDRGSRYHRFYSAPRAAGYRCGESAAERRGGLHLDRPRRRTGQPREHDGRKVLHRYRQGGRCIRANKECRDQHLLGSNTNGFRPAITLARNERLEVLVEADGSGPSDFEGLSAVAELRRPATEKALTSVQAVLAQTADPTRRVAQADFPTEGLEPGLYDVRVQLHEGNVVLGTINRQIRIE